MSISVSCFLDELDFPDMGPSCDEFERKIRFSLLSFVALILYTFEILTSIVVEFESC